MGYRKMRVYISGAISCLDKEEYTNRFERVEKYLLSQGYNDIVNPVKIAPYNNIPRWENYMIVAFALRPEPMEVGGRDILHRSPGVLAERHRDVS